MINNCDICKNKEKCSKFRINSKEWNNLTCYDFNEISSPQLVEHIIKNFCRDEHRSDLWINIEVPLYKTLNTLYIISQTFRLVGNCLHAKNEYAEDGWVFVKEIEDEQELNAWKEVLS